MTGQVRSAARAALACPLRLFFRPPSTPWVHLGFYGPLVAGAFLWNLLGEPPSPWALVGLPLGGVFLWTLLEYVLHAGAFHRPLGGALFRAVRQLHGGHHDDPDDPMQILTRLAFSFPAALLLWSAFRLLLGSWQLAALPTAGVAVGYLGYELIHYAIHRWPRGARLLRPLTRHHLYHHHKDPTRCFGVTTPLWDVVFRTGRPG
jgi:sterol desaturase/sphingolipid hydroxylase (fatty acid hydroxylase superfamily)